MKSNVYRLMSFGLAAVLAIAATAAEPAKEKKYVDPNEYASYGPGTASKAGDPSVAEWQKANEAAIKAATTPEALKAHLKDAAAAKASWITPVPGGVGRMTITMLLDNTVDAAERTVKP